MSKPVLAPELKPIFQAKIEENLDFGCFAFEQLLDFAALQYEHNREFYKSVTECPLRAVAVDLAVFFDGMMDACPFPAEEDIPDAGRLRFPLRGHA